jgi:hypothetical protein
MKYYWYGRVGEKCKEILVCTTMNETRYTHTHTYTRGLKFSPPIGHKLGKCTCKVLIRKKTVYGAEKWTVRKVDKKYLGCLEMWGWKIMEKIIYTDRMKN